MKALWRWLTEPSPSLTGIDRRRARLLASLLVALIALGTGSATIQLAVVPGFGSTFVVVMAAVSILGVVWAMVRAGRYKPAAAIASVLPSLASMIAAAANPADVAALTFVSLGIMLASLLLSMRAAAVLGGSAVVGILLLPLVQPQLPFGSAIAAAAFNAIATSLLLVAAHHRDVLETDRLAEQARLHE